MIRGRRWPVGGIRLHRCHPRGLPRLRRASPTSRCQPGRNTAWLSSRMGGTVQVFGANEATSDLHHSHYTLHHLRPALPEFWVLEGTPHRIPGGSLFAYWIVLVPALVGLQPQHRGVGGAYCSGGPGGRMGVVLLLYLQLAHQKWKKEGRMRHVADLKEAIHYGAVQRLRPKLMTVLTTFMGLLPIMWASTYETGADVMKRMAAPHGGGIDDLLYSGAHHLSGGLLSLGNATRWKDCPLPYATGSPSAIGPKALISSHPKSGVFRAVFY